MLIAIGILSILCCAAMEESSLHIKAKTSPKSASRVRSREKEYEMLIREGSLAEFKAQEKKVDELEFDEIEDLLGMINRRKRALELNKELRIYEDELTHIRSAITQMRQDEEMLRNKSTILDGYIPVIDRYTAQEQDKLKEIEKILKACKSNFEQEWVGNGERLGYTVTKKSKKG